MAWIQLYKPRDLRELIDVFNKVKAFPYFKVYLGTLSWLGLATFITPVKPKDGDSGNPIERTETLLQSLSRDYLDDIYTVEYNSLDSHGDELT